MLDKLCKSIHEHNGAEGKELMAYVFFVYAMYADFVKDKTAEAYFSKRCNECWAEHKEEQKKWQTTR